MGYPKGGQRPRAERFWAKVDKSGDCWLWTGSVFGLRGGYGQFYDDGGKVRRAHRVAWELATGDTLTEDIAVCHSCDVTNCVRPDHLFLGSQADNLTDMRDKERGYTFAVRRGTEMYNAKLNPDRVRIARATHAAGGNLSALAREWGVSQECVQMAATHKTWKHID